MDARALTIRELLEHRDDGGESQPVQFRIPIFQRDYSWGTEQIEQLMGRVREQAGALPDSARHFLGAFVLMQEDDEGGPDRVMVIDGQQRLLTLGVAITHLEQATGESVSVLMNRGMRIAGTERIEPAEVDYKDYDDLRRGLRPQSDRRLPRAMLTIARELSSTDPRSALDAILDRFQIVRVTLDRSEDAETVFESLNTTGLRLSQADLVRTVLLAQFGSLPDQQTYDNRYWRPMEGRLRDAVPDRQRRERSSPKDRIVSEYLRHVLMRHGQRVDGWRTYRTFVEQFDRTEPGAVAQLRTLEDLSRPYERLLAPKPISGRVDVYQRLQLLGYNVHWPLYLQISERAMAGDFDPAEIVPLLEGLESFFVRRIAVGWRTNILGRRFEELCRTRPGSPSEVWRFLESDWPSDERFKRGIRETPIYQLSWGGCRLMLLRLDLAYKHPESRIDDEASIEHVMPQTIGGDDRGRAWKAMLGADWERIHKQWLHTLPNLSITKTNSQMSNRPFVADDGKGKRDWYRDSLFQMNHRIAANETWAEAQMEARAVEFAANALDLWPMPDGVQGIDG